MNDAPLVDALVALCERAARRRAHETVDSWCTYDTDGVLRETIATLRSDEVIASNSAPTNFLWLVTEGGEQCGLEFWLPNFVRIAEERGAEHVRGEAERFVRFARLEDGAVEAEVTTTLVGLKLSDGVELELPFGRLRAGGPADLPSRRNVDERQPPAAVFAFDARIPAAVAPDFPFGGDDGAQLRDEFRRSYDERLTRMLVALVLLDDAPVQEHLIRYRARYSNSSRGISLPPLAPIVADWPYQLEAGPRVEKLEESAAVIAGIDVARLAVPTRRYLLARAERIRPEDQIVDYAIAIEALIGASGDQRARLLAELVAHDKRLPEAETEARAKRVSRARNSIVHEGTIPHDALEIALEGRNLVIRAIEASVQRAVSGVPPQAAWANVHPDALAHVREWPPSRWHSGSVQPHSSQALCVSVFGTLAHKRKRTATLAEIIAKGGIADLVPGTPRIVCEEVGQPTLLNELGTRTTPTSVDVFATWAGGVLAIESKFLEVGFGRCSQPGRGQCSGNFESGSDLKANTPAPCRLMVWDGKRSPRTYWDISRSLFRPDVVTPPRRPCPFAGPSFQLMRNLCFAAAAAQRRGGGCRFGFLVAYVEASPSATAVERELEEFKDLLLDDVRPRVGLISYEQIAAIVRTHGEVDLADFIARRIPEGIASAAR
jgi:hypothetical protein